MKRFFVLGLLALLVTSGAKADGIEVSKNLTLNGIFQGRCGASQDVRNNWKSGSLDIRRAELGFLVKVNNRISFKVQGDFATGTTVTKDLWMNYLFAPGQSVTLGQMVVPFGQENQTSDANLLTLERSTWVGMLFPGRRDRGIKVDFNGKGGQLIVAVFNGDGPNVKPIGNHKEGVVRVVGKLCPFAKLGASALYGNDKFGTRTAFGGDFQVNLLIVDLTGEYVRAHENGHNPEGWNAQAALHLGPADQLVAKFDRFSPDAPSDRLGQVDTYNIGLVHSCGKNMNLKLFYMSSQLERKGVSNGVGAEIMVHF